MKSQSLIEKRLVELIADRDKCLSSLNCGAFSAASSSHLQQTYLRDLNAKIEATRWVLA